MTRAALLLLFIFPSDAQRLARPIRPSAVADRAVDIHGNGWQPGQSAAISPESGGHRAQQGAPAERVEAPLPR